MDGDWRARSISPWRRSSVAESTPRMTPRVRRWRTSARVSISAATGMPLFGKKLPGCSSERQLLAMGENSRTIRPSM